MVRVKDATKKARKKRAQAMYKAAQRAEQLSIDLGELREGTMLTPGEKAVLLRADEMYLKAGGAVRKIALRLDGATGPKLS